jgi:hypothetical protein
MARRSDTTTSTALTHQLVVLPAKGEADTAVTCALDQTREGSGINIRDAAVLTVRPPDVCVTEPAEDWPGRRRLGHRWWEALAAALRDVGRTHEAHTESCFRDLVEAGMSKSFLEEAAMAVAGASTTVVLLAERVDVRTLLPKLEKGKFMRVIYGWLPDAAVDELATAGQT